MMKRVPIVVVLGATGAGKSKLALELAHKFGGEIISADAMQMYKGLDIVTNKVSDEEQKLVKHHMIDFLDPLLKSSVIDFRNQVSLKLKKWIFFLFFFYTKLIFLVFILGLANCARFSKTQCDASDLWRY